LTWRDEEVLGTLFVFAGAIFLTDAALIAGIPLLLMLCKRPGLALGSSVLIGALVIIDSVVNFDSVSYPKSMLFLGLPADVLPLSVFLMLATAALCMWAFLRDL
jgi:hypothetical protein